MNLIAPLTNQSCSWSEARSDSGGGIVSFFECQTELAKSVASTSAEHPECLLLGSVSKDRNHQVPSQVGRRVGMEELLPEITQLRLLIVGRAARRFSTGSGIGNPPSWTFTLPWR